MKWSFLIIAIGLAIISIIIVFLEVIFLNSIFWSFLIIAATFLNYAHILTHKLNWQLDTKKVLIVYFGATISLMALEVSLTGNLLWSFSLTVMSLFFVGHYLSTGFNLLFKQFHIKEVYRNLISFYLVFVYFYILLFFFLQTINQASLLVEFGFFLYLSLIAMILFTINSLIRIVAVAFHRRKYELFPINRIEYAALYNLEKTEHYRLNFTKLKDQIKGAFNIFTTNVYFDEKTAKSSIYSLCALGYADIDGIEVKLNEEGKKQGKVWKNLLITQSSTFNKILTKNSVLIRSFLGLFVLSLLKILIGLFNSESLLAEGFENLLDCVAVVLIVIGIRFKNEKLVNIVIISLMIFTGSSIMVNAIESLFIGPEPITNVLYIVIIALFSIFLNTYLRILKNFVGKKNRNSSLIASAIDSKVNIVLSISIILGALISNLGTSLGISIFYYGDPIIALFVCVLIFKEVIEIFRDLITSKEEEIEFEKFQMKYEQNFKEYIIKWILTLFHDTLDTKLTQAQLSKHFKESLEKGEEIYTEFAYFGLYLFKNNGINTVINELVSEGLLLKSDEGVIELNKKGKIFYDQLYSKELIKDLKDPFDFFFEQQISFDSIESRKLELLEKESLYEID